jgi:hypothetical protein
LRSSNATTPRTLDVVIAGLDPAIHLASNHILMDARVNTRCLWRLARA